jgi:hypothetical protein
MSKTVEGVIQLKCSLEVLRKALINIMPQWAEHIKVDPQGRIPMYGYEGKTRDRVCHLLIPGAGNPNYAQPPGRSAHNDWGFKLNSDGTWTSIKAEFGKAEAEKLEQSIKGEVAHMKTIAIAGLRGYKVREEETEEEKITYIEVDNPRQAHSLLA